MRFTAISRRILYLTPLLFIFVLQSSFISAFNPIPLPSLEPRSVFTVNTTNDTIDTNASDGICLDGNGECSLRAAVMSANYTDAADEIILPAGTYTLTRSGDDDNALNGDLDILRSVTITGADRDTTVIVQTLNDKAFQIDSLSTLTITVNLTNLTVESVNTNSQELIENKSTGTLNTTNVRLSTGFIGIVSTGIVSLIGSIITEMDYVAITSSSADSQLSITDSIISNNNGDGVLSYSSMPVEITNVQITSNGGQSLSLTEGGIIINSTVSNNSAGIGGKNLWIENSVISDNQSTGITLYGGTGKIIGTTVDHNTSASGAGGIQIMFSDTVDILNSTISNNTSTGLDGMGGGILTYNDTRISNTTISGNSSEQNGGGVYSAIVTTGAKLQLNNLTVTNNSALNGGGIYTYIGVVEAANTIIAGNSATVQGADCYDTENHITSQGYNLLGDSNSCPNFTASGDQVGVNPLLAALADNGGLTKTHALQAGSPAINVGNPATCIGYDQRYYPRNGTCDIGAYEADAPMTTVTPTVDGPTPTSTPVGGGHQLVANGGFEAKTADNKPDLLPWTLKNESKDKVKCNKPDKTVAYEGDCAFLFKGITGENANLSQNADARFTFNVGDTLIFSLYAYAKGTVNLKGKVKVVYSDSTLPDKITLMVDPNGGYTLVQEATILAGSTVSKIKVQLKNRSTSGKIYLDAVSLSHSTESATGQNLIPLP